MKEDPNTSVIEHEGTTYRRYKIDNVCSCVSCAAYKNAKLCVVLHTLCDVDSVYIAVTMENVNA